jgi:hypothetical protein
VHESIDERVNNKTNKYFKKMAFGSLKFGAVCGGGKILDANHGNTRDAKNADYYGQNVCQEKKVIAVGRSWINDKPRD